MPEQIDQLLKEVALAGTILPILLMVIPGTWSENLKKAITFVACILFTAFVAFTSGDFKFEGFDISNWVAHLVVVLTVASQTYDKVWKPAANTLAARAPKLKFLQRGTKTNGV